MVGVVREELGKRDGQHRGKRDRPLRGGGLGRTDVQMGLAALHVEDALDGLADGERLRREVDVLHLERAKLTDSQPGKEREEDARRAAVHAEIEPLDEFAFLILRERGHLMWRIGLRVFYERPVEQGNDAELVGVFHRKAEHENDVVYRLHADTAFTVESAVLMEFKDVGLHVRLGD